MNQQHIIVTEDPRGALDFHGPFDTPEAASDYIAKHIDPSVSHWIADLEHIEMTLPVED